MRHGKQKTLSLEPKWYLLEIVMTVVIALILSLLLVLLFAFLIKMLNLETDIIPIFICGIKIVSILTASIFCLKRPNVGWIRGASAGIIYILLSFFVFSILGGEFTFGLGLLNDVAIGMVAGIISGVIAVNVRSR